MIVKLPPENDCGCAEYKYKFDKTKLIKTPKRLEQLQTQLLYNEWDVVIVYTSLSVMIRLKESHLKKTYSESVLLDMIYKIGFTLVNKQDIGK